jgi:hypothetical protein
MGLADGVEQSFGMKPLGLERRMTLFAVAWKWLTRGGRSPHTADWRQYMKSTYIAYQNVRMESPDIGFENQIRVVMERNGLK